MTPGSRAKSGRSTPSASTPRGIKLSTEVSAAKLLAPTRPVGTIPRIELFERCFSEVIVRLVVLQAPAGHGKTTALLQLKEQSERSGARTAWLTFDAADNDSRRFSVHLQAAINQVAPAQQDDDADEQRSNLLVPWRRSDWLIDRLLLSGEAIALFFDDFQFVTNPDLLAFCKEFFERLPENVRIYIGTRAEPGIRLSRMIVSNRAVILRTEELRFSRSEVARYFDGLDKISVSSQEVDSIFRLTEGWPVAIQLYGLGLASSEVRRSLYLPPTQSDELANYLSSSVLSLQEPGVRDFLLKTSILTRLSGPLCQAVTGRADAEQILLELERSGLFLRRLGSDTEWFKYHTLFSEFLAKQLRRLPATIEQDVHRAAAEWHRAHANSEEAVHHYLECADHAAAADVLAVWGKELVASGSLVTLEHWADRLPFEEIAARLDLSIAVAWALAFLRRTDKLRPFLQLFEGLETAGSVESTTDPNIVLSMVAVAADQTIQAFERIDRISIPTSNTAGFDAFELGAASNSLAYREVALGRFDQVPHYIAYAERCNEVSQAAFSHGYTVGVSGVSALLQGRLYDAVTLFRRGMAQHYSELGESFSLAALVSCYIWSLYEAGNYEAALSFFSQHRLIISGSALPDFCAVAYLSAIRASAIRGEQETTSELLQEAEDICRENGWARLRNLLAWERVRMLVARGEVSAASRAAGLIGAGTLPKNWLPFSEEMEGEGLGRLRLLAHTGSEKLARNALREEEARAKDRPFRRLRLQVIEAILLDRKGDKLQAQRHLRATLRTAEIGGYVSVFANEGRVVARMLGEMYGTLLVDLQLSPSEERIDPNFIESVLRACNVGVESVDELSFGDNPASQLSTREINILSLLGAGVSNKGMAKHLFLSENTIKYHLKNIFMKLNVASRSEALTAARRWGIIK